MRGMDNSVVNKLVTVASKIGRQRHLSAIRDGFISLIPLMIVGSIGTLINNFPTGQTSTLRMFLSENEFLSWIVTLNGNIWWGSMGVMSIFTVVTISYYLAKSYEGDALMAGLVSLSSFLASTPQNAVLMAGDEEISGWGFISTRHINAQGLFVAILIALVATELFVRFSKSEKLTIKMPAGVPPAVSKSFGALIPGALTVIAVNFVTVMLEKILHNNVFDAIYESIAKPLSNTSGSLGFGLVIVFLTHFLWIFGIHGPNMFEGILQTLNAMAIENNQNLMNMGASEGFTIFNKSFVDTFVYMGGAGVGLGLIIAILMLSKHEQIRRVGQIGVAPGVFNINEPILFGLPIVLNPVFAIPFILAPMISLVVAYTATTLGLLPPVGVIIPWTTPPILSGLFASNFSIWGPIVQIINLGLSIVIYIPFVKIADRVEAKKEKMQNE
ncbi:PTS system cellobiose-specific IIC component [Aequitasia blattaphilus]|uniref:Permease IIC component n=1 Tax=Aequitasia blattaphilus TaxID=2949332 RepID=A0ABT1E7N3_9FIRM|nr:PTS sugar transporter subunit IIC [Aequitasia blattaphilus]MCP1100866.1 PTS sugar transporter subunit IIC [Aequitasia blattaphilus]MCR8613506.1 PTS sugar transporter subunit IIC [Aequitasia blattaphilus]